MIDAHVLLDVGWFCVALIQRINRVRLKGCKQEHFINETRCIPYNNRELRLERVE